MNKQFNVRISEAVLARFHELVPDGKRGQVIEEMLCEFNEAHAAQEEGEPKDDSP